MKRLWLAGVLLSLLAALALGAWLPSQSLWRWQLSLATLELGHWLALASLVAGLGAGLAPRRRRLALTIAGLSLPLTTALFLPAWQASRMEPAFSWTRLYLPQTPDGVRQEEQTIHDRRVVIYRPEKTAGPLPWIVQFHSGGWEGGDPGEFAPWNRALVSRGCVILCVGYRVAPAHPWPAPREDAVQVIRWARENAAALDLDPARLFLMGRSAGGQIATAVAYGLPELETRGVISFYGPADMRFAREYALEDDILNSLKLLRQYLGGDPADAEENYSSASAIEAVSASCPPTLLLHGAQDPLVWVKQSERLAGALAKAGSPYTFLRLPWATHGCDYFSGSPGYQVALAAVWEFIQ